MSGLRFEVIPETLILLCKLNTKRITMAPQQKVQLRLTWGSACTTQQPIVLLIRKAEYYLHDTAEISVPLRHPSTLVRVHRQTYKGSQPPSATSSVFDYRDQSLWRMASSGMLRRVDLVRTDVSEELRASIIRVTIGELERTLAVNTNRRTLRRNTK
jgi:hypothetical protein